MLSHKPWRPLAVWLFVVAQMTSLFLGVSIMAALRHIGVAGFRDPGDSGNILIGTLSFQGATWILMAAFFRHHHVGWLDALGFGRRVLPALLLALATVVVVLWPVLWLQELSATIMQKFGWTPQNEVAVTLLAGTNSPAMQIYLVIFAVALAPVAEEFIFRGMLYPCIKQLGYPKTAWISVNLLFALVHGNAAILIPLFVLALALTWLYEITDSLLAPIAGHALFNVANLLLLKYLPQ